MKYDGVLVLEDGSTYGGSLFGYHVEAEGEIVFNTGMVGYTESMTDPSYCDQLLIFTYPLIGCYGVPDNRVTDEFGLPVGVESNAIQVSGIIVHSLQRNAHHWCNSKSLDGWMKEHKVPGIEILDTRALTKKIRGKGTMRGKICTSKNPSFLLKDTREGNVVRKVTAKKIEEYSSGHSPRIALVDCGLKLGILRSVLSRNMDVLRVPYDTSLDKIMSFEISGILVSNGPGNPRLCEKTIETIRCAMETDIPIMGICLGHQILALASGANTHKMKFGHRGQNHPCMEVSTKRCYITSQNHGYAVDGSSFGGTGFHASFLNANDGSVEGMTHNAKPFFGVQFHPEGSPGTYDTSFLFDIFMRNVHAFKE